MRTSTKFVLGFFFPDPEPVWLGTYHSKVHFNRDFEGDVNVSCHVIHMGAIMFDYRIVLKFKSTEG